MIIFICHFEMMPGGFCPQCWRNAWCCCLWSPPPSCQEDWSVIVKIITDDQSQSKHLKGRFEGTCPVLSCFVFRPIIKDELIGTRRALLVKTQLKAADFLVAFKALKKKKMLCNWRCHHWPRSSPYENMNRSPPPAPLACPSLNCSLASRLSCS